MGLCLVNQFGFERCFEKHGFMIDLFDQLGFLAVFSFVDQILYPALAYGFD